MDIILSNTEMVWLNFKIPTFCGVMGLICSKINLTSSDYLGPGGKSITGAFLANVGEIHSSLVFGKDDPNKKDSKTGIQCSQHEINDSEILHDVYIVKRRRRTLQRLSSSTQMPPIDV